MEMTRFEELVLKGMKDQKFKRNRISRSERRELAKETGSTTGHLKKKHLNRIRIYINDVINETIQENING